MGEMQFLGVIGAVGALTYLLRASFVLPAAGWRSEFMDRATRTVPYAILPALAVHALPEMSGGTGIAALAAPAPMALAISVVLARVLKSNVLVIAAGMGAIHLLDILFDSIT